jgi:hypothetical protein
MATASLTMILTLLSTTPGGRPRPEAWTTHRRATSITLTSFALPPLRLLALLHPFLGGGLVGLGVEEDFTRCGGGHGVLQK